MLEEKPLYVQIGPKYIHRSLIEDSKSDNFYADDESFFFISS